MRKKIPLLLSGLAVLILLAVGLYFVPSIHGKIAARLYLLRDTLIYAIHPPKELAFVPTQQGLLATITGEPSDTPTSTPLPTDVATSTPTTTPLPSSDILSNVPFVGQ